MKALALASLAAALLFSGVARTQTPDTTEAVYKAGSEYTATLEQSQNRWRLQPVNGQDVVIDIGSCATGAMVPAGVWLLVIDDLGRPALLAPSATLLPAGLGDRIALRACDQARGRDLAVPQSVLDLLTANTGAIYVRN
jgi:hypothetical protein